MELIILTLSGVDFTTIPVTESCVSQSLDCIFPKLRVKDFETIISARQSILTEIIIYWKSQIQGSNILPRPGIEPLSPRSQSDALAHRAQ